MKRKLSLLIPFYNEEEVLPMLHDRLCVFIDERKEYEWEILMVNDGSTDRGLDIVKSWYEADARWRYLDLSRNFGKEIAMMAGFDNVSGDCVVIMDADLQDPPEVIDEMIQLWQEGYDDVYGTRKSRGNEPWIRRNLTTLYYKILKRASDIPVLQNTGDFRLLDRICIDSLREMRETQRYTKGLYCWIGYRKKEITFDRQDRAAGKTHWNFLQLCSLAVEGITSYTTFPLRIATVLGLVGSIISIILIIFYLVKTIIWGDPVQGFPTLITVLLFMGSLILFFLGVIGEYLGRIFNEVKRRPPYFIREMDGEKVNHSVKS